MADHMQRPQAPSDPVKLQFGLILHTLCFGNDLSAVIDKIGASLGTGHPTVHEPEPDSVEVVWQIEPKQHGGPTSHILFLDGGEHAIYVSARDDISLVDTLLQLFTVFLQHLKFREVGLTFSV